MEQFTADVISGAGRGKGLGFPTLNLSLDAVPATLKHGIYACIVYIGKDQYPAAVHFGPRPTFDDTISFEVHLLDTELNDAPNSLQVHVIEHIRDVRGFDSADELTAQLEKDCDQVRGILDLS